MNLLAKVVHIYHQLIKVTASNDTDLYNNANSGTIIHPQTNVIYGSNDTNTGFIVISNDYNATTTYKNYRFDLTSNSSQGVQTAEFELYVYNNAASVGYNGNTISPESVSTTNYDGTNAISIGCGGYFSGIILEGGRLETVGWDNGGPLGYSGSTSVTNPAPREISHTTDGYNGSNAVKFTGGFHHIMVLLSNGKVLTAGYNQYGQLGRKYKYYWNQQMQIQHLKK